MPYFMCDSVVGVCRRLGIEIEYYHITRDFMPVFDKACAMDEWLYVVNDYRQLANAQIEEMKERYGNIIVDNVQAFFSTRYKELSASPWSTNRVSFTDEYSEKIEEHIHTIIA